MTTSAIYASASAERERTGRDPYLTTADTARLIRQTLERAYPGVRFYVRSSTYAGGSSIRVAYDGVQLDGRGRPLLTLVDYDGVRQPGAPVITEDEIDYRAGRYGHIPRAGAPVSRDVEALVSAFAGRAFDGMIDMAYSLRSWLNPDGSMSFAGTDGTAGSMGSVPAAFGSRRHPSALLVHPGASYVFVESQLPYDVRVKRSA